MSGPTGTHSTECGHESGHIFTFYYFFTREYSLSSATIGRNFNKKKPMVSAWVFDKKRENSRLSVVFRVARVPKFSEDLKAPKTEGPF